MDFSGMSAIDKQILIFSFYRDAELRGARLLFNIIGHLKDGDSQLKMTKHLSDETRHAWLWTRRIADLGGTPVFVPDGYQRRLGMRIGVPRGIVEVLGLTVVVEERAQSRYMAHAALPNVDEDTLEVLKARDRRRDLASVVDRKEDARNRARGRQCEGKADEMLERYRDDRSRGLRDARGRRGCALLRA